MSIRSRDERCPIFSGHLSSGMAHLGSPRQSHQGFEGNQGCVPYLDFENGTRRVSHLSKKVEIQSYQGFSGFRGVPNSDRSERPFFPLPGRSELNRTNASSNLCSRIACPTVSHIFRQIPFHLRKYRCVFIHSLE
jgi:hypothetical protein